MPDGAAPAPGAPAPPRDAVSQASQPLFSVDGAGERVALGGMVLLFVGCLLPWGGSSGTAVGPILLAPGALLPLVLAVLAILQVASAASKIGDMLMVGLAAIAGLAGILGTVAEKLIAHASWGPGLPVALLGVAVGVTAVEMHRRELGLTYVGMATRIVELALLPRVQIALLKLLLPFALVGLVAFGILEVFGDQVANKLAAVFLIYFFNPVGKEVGIPFALGEGPPISIPPAIDPVLTWAFIVFIDLTTCLFLVWNFDHVLKVPYLGRFFAWIERKGRDMVERRKWIRRLAFGGLALYATLPLEGTGAIGGSVVGRAIGLNAWRTFAAVGMGSMIRTSITTLLVVGALQYLHL